MNRCFVLVENIEEDKLRMLMVNGLDNVGVCGLIV